MSINEKIKIGAGSLSTKLLDGQYGPQIGGGILEVGLRAEPAITASFKASGKPIKTNAWWTSVIFKSSREALSKDGARKFIPLPGDSRGILIPEVPIWGHDVQADEDGNNSFEVRMGELRGIKVLVNKKQRTDYKISPPEGCNIVFNTPLKEGDEIRIYKPQALSPSAPMYPQPLMMQAETAGLGIGHRHLGVFSNYSVPADDLADPKLPAVPLNIYNYKQIVYEDKNPRETNGQELLIGVGSEDVTELSQVLIDDYSDTTATLGWVDKQGKSKLVITAGSGLPFLYCKTDGTPAAISIVKETELLNRRNDQGVTEIIYNGILPFLPDAGIWDKSRNTENYSLLRRYLFDYYKFMGTDHVPAPPFVQQTKNAYDSGKDLGALAQLIGIAEQLGEEDIKDYLLTTLRNNLALWFDATPGQDPIGFTCQYPSDQPRSTSAVRDPEMFYYDAD